LSLSTSFPFSQEKSFKSKKVFLLKGLYCTDRKFVINVEGFTKAFAVNSRALAGKAELSKPFLAPALAGFLLLVFVLSFSNYLPLGETKKASDDSSFLLSGRLQSEKSKEEEHPQKQLHQNTTASAPNKAGVVAEENNQNQEFSQNFGDVAVGATLLERVKNNAPLV